MTFADFLAALGSALDDAAVAAGAPADPAQRPFPHARYDPTCQEASAPDLILIGLGGWSRGGRPVEHRGACLNNKGLAGRYSTVTDLVLAPPAPLREHWERLTAADHGPVEILRRCTLVVEDAGPDSCLALLCWLARCSGVDLDAWATAEGRRWVRAVRQWETTGMVVDPTGAWAALLSALAHGRLPATGSPDDTADRPPPDLSRAWREALRLTVALLREGADPGAVPPVWHLGPYVRARAFLDVERQEYRQSLAQATCLQLWVPLAGNGGTRRLLVDAYFATETWPSGARKLFARTDREHTELQQGFALMGLYRPGAQGTGADMTLSVNPWTGIDLQLLWTELERLETARWEGRRPADAIRPLASYPPGTGYNQPWWDDGGRYTLLGAPKALPDWPAGSRLTWAEVLEAAWQCYSPLAGLRVHDLLAEVEVPLAECRCETLQAADGAVTRHLAAVRWLPDTTRPQSLFLAPTTRRALAALVARGPDRGPVTLAQLPAAADLDLAPLTGGFAVLHPRGVLLFDDWRGEHLPVAGLVEEVRRGVRWLGTLHKVERHLAIGRHADPRREVQRHAWQAIGVLADLAAQRSRLAQARDRNAPASLDPEVRRFRAQLNARWGLDQTAEDLQRRITQLEDAIRTSSALHTQGLVQVLSVYGLPFIISNGITSQLAPLLESAAGTVTENVVKASLFKFGVYVGLAVVLIVLMRLIQHLWLKAATRSPAGSAAPTAPDDAPATEV